MDIIRMEGFVIPAKLAVTSAVHMISVLRFQSVSSQCSTTHKEPALLAPEKRATNALTARRVAPLVTTTEIVTPCAHSAHTPTTENVSQIAQITTGQTESSDAANLVCLSVSDAATVPPA